MKLSYLLDHEYSDKQVSFLASETPPSPQKRLTLQVNQQARLIDSLISFQLCYIVG